MTEPAIAPVMIEQMKKFCREIGCSGVDLEMCQTKLYLCSIVRKAETVWKTT